MSRCVRRSPRASVQLHLGGPVVCGARLGHQCSCTWEVSLCVALASGVSAAALGRSRCVWRSPRASVQLHLGGP
eukprot:6438996-Alexandrium_andersonii.AAC.1